MPTGRPGRMGRSTTCSRPKRDSRASSRSRRATFPSTTGFIWADRPLAPDDKAQALLTPETRGLIGALVPLFEATAPWDAASTEACVRAFAEGKGVKLGAIAQPLRAALTGRTTSPPIFDVLTVLGKDESLARLRDQAA